MQSLKDKIVFITGASSGIGKACAEEFAKLNANIIITARRYDRIEKLANQLTEKYSINVLPIKLDVQDRQAVKDVIENLPSDWENIDILVNNAGLALSTDKVQDADIDNWDQMIDTNIKGLLYITRAIVPSMVKRNQGHIINIGSIAGYEYYPAGNVYSATKHAVKAISKSLLLDLLDTKIRVSAVNPGMVETEFSEVRWNDKERAKAFYEDVTPLEAENIADGVVFCATRPAHVNIADMMILPVDQASANHVNRSGKTKNVFE